MLDLKQIFTTFPVLESERLFLRAHTPDDSADVLRIMSNPQVIRYFGSLPMKSADEAAQRIERINESFRSQSGIRWAICIRGKNQLIGSLGYWRLITEHKRAEIGYELAPEWWGQGIMPEAMRAILHYGFTAMDLHSVEAQIHPANHGSRRVLEKLGFEQEGYFRENFYDPIEQQFTDTAVFSLLKDGWRHRENQQHFFDAQRA
ncbi:MAG TPA: GNAT family N-acetyltransferase [Roseiflexaceae bacterium]|nr:GNAT family N-acetyltransferase [Roseiflexaceae bacterium]HMP42778.1 GNAT family N-acetyltransferase [Roseiflexaceae bacterium]